MVSPEKGLNGKDDGLELSGYLMAGRTL